MWISQACQCTTAAPTFFEPITVLGRKYIDGGVIANNPADIAWTEACDMVNPKGTHTKTYPQLLLSIGTGMPRKHSRFGLRKVFRGALSDITATKNAHSTMLRLQNLRPTLKYIRLDVPEDTIHPQRGLSGIGLDQCEKKPISNSKGNPTDVVRLFQQKDLLLKENAKEATTKGGYKPHKYHYVTFDKIRDHTAKYCGPDNTEIFKCAKILRDQSLQRRTTDRPRWDKFRNHPNPDYKV